MTYINVDAHFLNYFLEKCPFSRYCTIKYRSVLGKNSFVRYLIQRLNDTLLYFILYKSISVTLVFFYCV